MSVVRTTSHVTLKLRSPKLKDFQKLWHGELLMLTVTPNMDLAASITDRIDRERFETKTETWITRDLDPNLPAPF